MTPVTVTAHEPPADDAPRAGPRMFEVQVRYPRSGWVTVVRTGNRRAALRAAATAYRHAVLPDGGTPSQVRLLET